MSKSFENYKTPAGFLPVFCVILEICAISVAAAGHHSICVQAREISENVHLFFILIYPFILPDLIMFCLTYVTLRVTIRPFTLFYHMMAVIVCFSASIYLLAGVTYCGNKAQILFLVASILGLIAAILHAVLIFFVGKVLRQLE